MQSKHGECDFVPVGLSVIGHVQHSEGEDPGKVTRASAQLLKKMLAVYVFANCGYITCIDGGGSCVSVWENGCQETAGQDVSTFFKQGTSRYYQAVLVANKTWTCLTRHPENKQPKLGMFNKMSGPFLAMFVAAGPRQPKHVHFRTLTSGSNCLLSQHIKHEKLQHEDKLPTFILAIGLLIHIFTYANKLNSERSTKTCRHQNKTCFRGVSRLHRSWFSQFQHLLYAPQYGSINPSL